MADNTTELEVLDQIVDVLGGTSGQYETVVPVLKQIKELLASGITDPEAIAEAVHNELMAHPEWTTTVQDGSITGVKIADDTIPDAKLAQTGGVLEAVANKLDNFEQFDFTVANSRVNSVGNIVGSTGQNRTNYIPCTAGTQVEWRGMSFIYQGNSAMSLIAFFDTNKTFISGVTKISDETVSTVGKVTATAPEGTAYVIGSVNDADSSYGLTLYDVKQKLTNVLDNFDSLTSDVALSKKEIHDLTIRPILRNGTAGNVVNQYGIASDTFIDNRFARFNLSTSIELPSNEYQYYWVLKPYSRQEASAGGNDYYYPATSKTVYAELPAAASYLKYVRVGLFINYVGSTSTTDYALRIEDVGTDVVTVTQVPSFANLDAVQANIDKLFVSSAYNMTGTIDAKCASYSAEFVGLEDTESFLFFTDPHIFPHTAQEANMEKAIGTIEYAYNNTPTSFVLCGGDWLQSGDTAAEAANSLGRIDGIMRAKFGFRYYPILGNHDNNYQGAGGAYPNPSPYTLSNDTIRQLWFREYGANYYGFETPSGTRFYVFDTGTDWNTSMDTYRWEQVDWFARELAQNDDAHSVIALHIIINSGTAVANMADNITKVAQAYNARASVTLNGSTYDFSAATGKVAFAIAGHTHADSTDVLNDIPYIVTLNAGFTPSFDLCLIDYDNAKLKTVRVGSGSDREISIII